MLSFLYLLGCVDKDQEFEGYDLDKSNKTANTWLDCQNLCNDTNKCHFWTWDNNLCSLKNEKAQRGLKAKFGAISGSKECPCKGFTNEIIEKWANLP